ncbi:hypothetical protein [Caldibacillus debilis]|uniref:hypothetical protein n=1 Tax=Caldibacillus debilis TaxID=301148 RepID=UPI00077935DE|nr:hypothetical protein [Caldibacillus debilis]
MWKVLFVINPVGIREAVPNAAIRQSNTCFSSSDQGFSTRYEAEKRIAELGTGKVPVKGAGAFIQAGPGSL